MNWRGLEVNFKVFLWNYISPLFTSILISLTRTHISLTYLCYLDVFHFYFFYLNNAPSIIINTYNMSRREF